MAHRLVDWGLARSTAVRVAGPGPQIPLADARAAVAELRRCAAQAVDHVASYTGLHAPFTSGSVAVVDRKGWVDANVEGFASIVEPVLERLRGPRTSSPATTALLPRVAALELGGALGFLGSKVLGQYELFTPEGRTPRLLLVVPNVVHVEQELQVPPGDFRLWVCLHEETHRLQFGANPWLGPWLRAQIQGYLDGLELDGSALVDRLRRIGGTAIGAWRGLDAVGVLEALMTPDEKAVLDRLTAVMSLLEGHADVVMDGVGPAAVPSVATIRQRFQHRRDSAPAREMLVRKVLGLDSKLRQYRDGAAFTRAVVHRVGMAGFNQVWQSPQTLPSRTELHDPDAWLRRVVSVTGHAPV